MSTTHHQEAAALNRSAALASIAVASVLVALKGWAAITTGSAAMLGSLADTALDLVSSIATLAGVWVAAQPADDKHRFGHGKAEALSAMFQVVLISISALALGIHSTQEWLAGARTASPEGGMVVSAVAVVGTLALLAWQRHVIRRTGSVAISTDHLHYQADLGVNLAVIVALVLDHYFALAGADAAFGLGIAVWLGWGAWTASHEAITQLMDREWDEDKKARFIQVLGRHPELRGVHDLRTRTSGNHDFVQFHVWVDGNMTVHQAHKVMDEIEAKLLAEFPGVEILIHPDPDGLVNEHGPAGENVLPG
ncbi:MAG: cation diffusion facilitator family transporter [Proteobacteria bacterium]|nr:cation diffusion facilitator family transporter [Pseudomonadota bacterium]